MDDKLLTDEQYSILLIEENAFETLAKQGWCINFDVRYLSRLRDVYQEFFHSPLNTNCGACVHDGMVRLWNQMEKKKGDLLRIAEELKIIEDEKKIETIDGQIKGNTSRKGKS